MHMIDLAWRSKILNDTWSVLANKVFKTGVKVVDLLTINLSPFKETTIYPLKVIAICLPEVVKYL